MKEDKEEIENKSKENQNDEKKNKKHTSASYIVQTKIEEQISSYFKLFNFDTKNSEICDINLEIFLENHINFLNMHKSKLPGGYSSLDSGMPWFAYWFLNIFDLFSMQKFEMSLEYKRQFISYLKSFLNPTGGFSGYSKGYSHLISSYAAVLAIVCLDCTEAYEIIDREKMKNYLKSMKFKKDNLDTFYDYSNTFLIKKNEKISSYEAQHYGSFQVHHNGESDLRSTYCALVIAYVLNILDEELIEGIAENIKNSQTYEGGLGPEPFSEAHGGYNFCGIASLLILGKLDIININKQIRWLVNRQLSIEGGFQGRTNKLVDACYSTWQGAVFNMLLEHDPKKYTQDSELLYDQLSLQAYLLIACQQETGGILDKPGKSPDLFHLNYGGMGLAFSMKTTCKEHPNKEEVENKEKNNNIYSGYLNLNEDEMSLCLSYDDSMELAAMDPVFCVPKEKLIRAINYFYSLKPIK